MPRGFGICNDREGVTAPPLHRYDACVELLPGCSRRSVRRHHPQSDASGAYAQAAYRDVAADRRTLSAYPEEWSATDVAGDRRQPAVMEIYLNDPAATPPRTNC